MLLSTFGSEGDKNVRMGIDKRASTVGWLLIVTIFLLQLQTHNIKATVLKLVMTKFGGTFKDFGAASCSTLTL